VGGFRGQGGGVRGHMDGVRGQVSGVRGQVGGITQSGAGECSSLPVSSRIPEAFSKGIAVNL
jgi:hypothetical protein